MELVHVLERAEERAAAREERDMESERWFREKELELQAEMRERDNRHEERMMTLFSSLMQYITTSQPQMFPPPPPPPAFSYNPHAPFPPPVTPPSNHPNRSSP